MEFNEIEKLVLEWADERKIIDFNAWRQMYPQVLRTQCLKLTEEIGELLQAMYDCDEDAVKDAIGDSLVVMTSLVWALPNHSIETTMLDDLYKQACADKYTSYHSLDTLAGSALGNIASAIVKNKPSADIKQGLFRLMIFLHHIAKDYELSLVECYEAAYNVIKDRKGKTTVDGNFIKEGD